MAADAGAWDAPGHCGGDGAVVVLGIGNLLWADEGFGVRCVERLQRDWELPGVVLVDGGTQGLYLIQHVQAAGRLLIFDAIDYGLAPGTLLELRDDEVPRYLGAKKMSLHQTGFADVLALARLTGQYPRAVALVGCQPEELDDYGGSLRESVRAALPEAIDRGLAILRAWGVAAVPRRQALDAADTVTLPHLSIERYETGRPSADAACRVGDARFFPEPR
jgi:hydrogenase maturation protease|uniref:Putative protease n=1 Tax=uncultured bacterium UPO47 TaxID=1776972 RepID=A0A126SYA2_9BACT|nr:putative protease [uncultured bacterium UPO47]